MGIMITCDQEWKSNTK